MTKNTDNAARRLRIERLIGTDSTKGLRGDLARAHMTRALWLDTVAFASDKALALAEIDAKIAKLAAALTSFYATLAGLS